MALLPSLNGGDGVGEENEREAICKVEVLPDRFNLHGELLLDGQDRVFFHAAGG